MLLNHGYCFTNACNFVCSILMVIYLNLDMYRGYSFIANLNREICIVSHTLESIITNKLDLYTIMGLQLKAMSVYSLTI